MNLVIAASGSSQWFIDAIKCAVARSGCTVHVVTDIHGIVDGSHYCDVPKLDLGIHLAHYYPHKSQLRWKMIQWLVRELGLKPPIVSFDWDMLAMWNIEPSVDALSSNDVAVTMEWNESSAPYVIYSISVLDAYCKWITGRIERFGYSRTLQDMITWREFSAAESLSVGTLSEEWRGGVWDHNICSGSDRFEFDENKEKKKIVWIGRKPYAISRFMSRLVGLRVIHCWGRSKNNTGSMLECAGIA